MGEKKAEVNSGTRAGLPSEVAEKLKPLERENREHHSSFWRAEALFTKALSCFTRLTSKLSWHKILLWTKTKD